MSYLFFDIEAANRHEGIAKIYSFGYVLTDNDFKIIEKDEIIINPDAEYYFTSKGEHVKIECPIDPEVMKKAKLFPGNYERIKKLLTSNICIGYGTSIDAYMLHESCKRYNLPSIRFNFYDLIEIADSLLGDKIPGLNKLADQLEFINDNPHNGLSDAYTTYKACKKLMGLYNRDLGSMRYKKEIFLYQAKKYKVFRLRDNKLEYVPKRKFKDMKIKDVEEIDLDSNESDKTKDYSNSMKEKLESWIKQNN